MPTWTVEDQLSVDLEDVYDVKIRLICGDVVVTAGDGPAHLEVGVISGDPVEVVHELEALRVFHPEVTGPGAWNLVSSWTWGDRIKPEAAVTLRVPAGTPVDVTTVAASAAFRGLEESLRVNTVSGDVAIKDVKSSIKVNTVSGRVDVVNLDGDLRANTVSAPVSVAGGHAGSVDAKTVSGDVSLDVGLHPDGLVRLTTVSGSVGLFVPPDPSFTIDATTMSGRLVSDLGLSWEGRGIGRRRLHHTVGSGGTQVKVNTLSGEVRILKRRVAA